MKKTMAFALAAGLSAVTTVALAGSMEKDKPAPACFRSSQFESWKAPDRKTIYIRTSTQHYYRLDLAAPCYALKTPGAFLVTRIRGSNTICSAIDWDLHVATSWDGIPQACIVKKMTNPSPAEVKALPRKLKP